MPGSFLSQAERERFNRFPSLISEEDLIAFFTLSASDRIEIEKQRGDHNRLGFSLQICTIRYLGFIPQDLSSAPIEAIRFIGKQMSLSVTCLADYARRIEPLSMTKQSFCSSLPAKIFR
jgi:TnpA family transposase